MLVYNQNEKIGVFLTNFLWSFFSVGLLLRSMGKDLLLFNFTIWITQLASFSFSLTSWNCCVSITV